MSKAHMACAVAGCTAANVSMHILPRDTALRKVWVKYIFSNKVPENISQHLRICTAHFSPDCIENQAMYNAGFASKFILTPGSVPTVLNPASDIRQVRETDSDVEEADADRVPHAVAVTCLLTSLKWLEQQHEASTKQMQLLRELHALAVRKRERPVPAPVRRRAVYAGGNLSRIALPGLNGLKGLCWIRRKEVQLSGGGLDTTRIAAPKPNHIEPLIKVEVDGTNLPFGTCLGPDRIAAVTVSGEHMKTEQDSELADLNCVELRSDKLKCEPTDISISDHTSVD